ncbi:MAG: hypothetical protein LBP65_02260 [Puniceicoccales bacterium]|nr:hypothetical protein [Puniceicoccales bacterium]
MSAAQHLSPAGKGLATFLLSQSLLEAATPSLHQLVDAVRTLSICKYLAVLMYLGHASSRFGAFFVLLFHPDLWRTEKNLRQMSARWSMVDDENDHQSPVPHEIVPSSTASNAEQLEQSILTPSPLQPDLDQSVPSAKQAVTNCIANANAESNPSQEWTDKAAQPATNATPPRVDVENDPAALVNDVDVTYTEDQVASFRQWNPICQVSRPENCSDQEERICTFLDTLQIHRIRFNNYGNFDPENRDDYVKRTDDSCKSCGDHCCFIPEPINQFQMDHPIHGRNVHRLTAGAFSNITTDPTTSLSESLEERNILIGVDSPAAYDNGSAGGDINRVGIGAICAHPLNVGENGTLIHISLQQMLPLMLRCNMRVIVNAHSDRIPYLCPTALKTFFQSWEFKESWGQFSNWQPYDADGNPLQTILEESDPVLPMPPVIPPQDETNFHDILQPGISPTTPFIGLYCKKEDPKWIAVAKQGAVSFEFAEQQFFFLYRPFMDGGMPEVDLLVEWLGSIYRMAAGTTPLIHCKAGVGRSALLITCYNLFHIWMWALENKVPLVYDLAGQKLPIVDGKINMAWALRTILFAGRNARSSFVQDYRQFAFCAQFAKHLVTLPAQPSPQQQLAARKAAKQTPS